MADYTLLGPGPSADDLIEEAKEIIDRLATESAKAAEVLRACDAAFLDILAGNYVTDRAKKARALIASLDGDYKHTPDGKLRLEVAKDATREALERVIALLEESRIFHDGMTPEHDFAAVVLATNIESLRVMLDDLEGPTLKWRCGKCGLVQPDSYDAGCDRCGASNSDLVALDPNGD